jgi:hypothetical protein
MSTVNPSMESHAPFVLMSVKYSRQLLCFRRRRGCFPTPDPYLKITLSTRGGVPKARALVSQNLLTLFVQLAAIRWKESRMIGHQQSLESNVLACRRSKYQYAILRVPMCEQCLFIETEINCTVHPPPPRYKCRNNHQTLLATRMIRECSQCAEQLVGTFILCIIFQRRMIKGG